MAAVVTTTDSPEAVQAALGDKGTVTVHDDAGNDITAAKKVVEKKDDAAPKEGENTEASAASGDSKGDDVVDKLNKRFDKLESSLTAAKPPEKIATKVEAPAAKEVEPKPEDFDTQADYFKALTKFQAKQIREEEKAEEAKQAETERKTKAAESWQGQVKTAKAKYADWGKVMSDDVYLGKTAAQMLVESPDGAEMAYYLGKNPEKAKEIAALKNERDIAMAIGELRAEVKAALKTIKKEDKEDDDASAENVSGKAVKPKPITPVGGQSKGNVSKEPKDMTYQEYKAYKKQQQQRKSA